jgi:hypothetical protein
MTSGMIIVLGLLAFALVAGLLLASNRNQSAPSSGETWRAFAESSGGAYSQNPLGRARKVTFTDGGPTITLEGWSTLDGPGDSIQSYSKFLAQGSFEPQAPFQLHAESRRSSQLSLSLTQRGGEPFQTGDPGLDAAYAARSSDPARASALMRNPRVRELLLRLSRNEAYLDLASDGGRWLVRFGDEDAPLSVARLQDARQLIMAVLDDLAASGAARKP